MSSNENEPPVVPPPPRMKGGNLPDVDHERPSDDWQQIPDETARPLGALPEYTIVDDPELSKLAPSALYELNQAALDEAVPDRPLIAPLVPMEVLREEYENGNQVFVQQINWLIKQGYPGIRRTRGDGDCFYRSLAYAYIERILNSPDQMLAVVQAMSALEATQPILEAAGFQSLVFEDFLETFVALIKRICQVQNGEPLLTYQGLLESFNNPEVSNSIVMYLRLLTSAHIRLDPDSYAPFLFHPELGEPMDTRDFCENFVEAVGKEADHVQITALTRALKVNILVAYLDGRVRTKESSAMPDKGKGRESNTVEVEFVPFRNEEDGIGPICLLYRPGHYDILERKREDSGAGIGLGVVSLP